MTRTDAPPQAPRAARVPVALPAGIATMAPGPQLGEALAQVHVSQVAGRDVVILLQAWSRQLNHTSAHLLDAVREAGRVTDPDATERLRVDAGDGAEEARAALVWSRRAATARHALAEDLLTRLPEVFLALRSGRIDEARARCLSQATTDLDPVLVTRVLQRLLPVAGSLLLGALRERVLSEVLALDPDWARRRRERDLTTRRVIASRTDSGTATLAGHDLPLERVVVAAARIERLAATAKAHGIALGIDALRADMFTGLLDGEFEGLDDADIVTLVLAEHGITRPTGTGHGTHDDGVAVRDAPPEADRPEPHQPDDGRPADRPPDSGDPPDPGGPGPGPRDPSPGPRPRPGGGAGDPRGADDDPEPGPVGPRPPTEPTPDPPHARAVALHRRTGEVRAPLSTLLGLDERPGELCGWGPVDAGQLRSLVEDHTAGAWEWVVTDADGRAVTAAPTRRRPSRAAGTARRGWMDVELAVPAALLDRIDPREHPRWERLLAEIRRVHRAAVEDAAPRRTTDPARRFADAATARAVRTRDRTCVAPSCRAPAYSTQLDHTHEHHAGGATESDNLGALCPYHHALKTLGRWRLTQPDPGHFHWTSPAGAAYRTRPRPVLDPLPEPRPHRDGRPRPLRESGTPLATDTGDLHGIRSSIWDTTTTHRHRTRGPDDDRRRPVPHPRCPTDPELPHPSDAEYGTGSADTFG